MNRAILTVHLPIGPCVITASELGLVSLRLGEVATGRDSFEAAAAHEHTHEARRQLLAYFGGHLRDFEIPVDLSGRTEFQRRVLEACRRVPYGETLTYGELALRAGYPRAARAVGQVMATNQVAIVVPCHRVIGSGGRLTGYGYGLDLKRKLLEMECGGGQNGCETVQDAVDATEDVVVDAR
ncbi:MAG: methylated-DNA--[protein]-cysteine S-methyltransferase [Armatimonadia bacterium]